MTDELCDKCKEFDKDLNGGPVSFDVFIVCNHQPERSKREDFFGMKAEIRSDGLCYFENGIVIDPSQSIEDAVL